MTAWSELAVESLTLIDDERLSEQLRDCPAAFFQRMAYFVKIAMPMLDRPVELKRYLERDMVEATADGSDWVSDEASLTQETDVETGLAGFDICSCLLTERLGDGTLIQTPCAVYYDAETGIVQFPKQERAGLRYELIFYRDGHFADLTQSQKALLYRAIALLWDERFTSAWLPRTPKLLDSSFQTEKGATWTKEQASAHRLKLQDFSDELKRYEQTCYYAAASGHGGRRVKLL